MEQVKFHMVHQFPRATMRKHKCGGLKNKNLWSQNSGCKKPAIKVAARRLMKHLTAFR